MPWPKLTGGVIFAALTVVASVSAMAAGAPLEREVKATFLYKFAPFVTWPDGAFGAPNAPFVICVLGDQGLADSLQPAVAGQRYGDHPVSVRAVTKAAADCQILYMPENDGASAAAAVAEMKGRPVLTVTDLPIDAAGHGMIDFVVDHGHVRFDIDNAAATECNLTISSKLLDLARVVKTKAAAP